MPSTRQVPNRRLAPSVKRNGEKSQPFLGKSPASQPKLTDPGDVGEVWIMSNEAQPVDRFSFWRMCRDFLAGLQKGQRYGMSLVAFLAIILMVCFMVTVGSYGVSTLHISAMLDRLF